MILKIIRKYRRSYLLYLTAVLSTLLLLSASLSMSSLKTAASLENAASRSGTYDVTIFTDSTGSIPEKLAGQVQILNQSRSLFTDPGELSLSWWSDFDCLSVELLQGELPDAEGEVSIGLNTALTSDWQPGMTLSADQTPAGKELLITGIHNDSAGLGDLLVFQKNPAGIREDNSSMTLYGRITDPGLVSDLQNHPELYHDVQFSAYGSTRWQLPGPFSRYLNLVSVLCIAASVLFLVLCARSFVRIIQPELDVLLRIGQSRSSIRMDLFLMLFVVPSAVSLLGAGLFTLLELLIWNGMGIHHWMQEAGISLSSFFLKIWGISEVSLLCSCLLLWIGSWFGRMRQRSRQKKASRSSSRKPPAFRYRKLFLTSFDSTMILFLCLLSLCTPLVVTESSQILEENEHPLLKIQDRDLRVDMYFKDQSAQELQSVFEQASRWAQEPGRTGLLELTGAAPLQTTADASDHPDSGSSTAWADLTIPLTSSLYEELTKDMNLPAETQVVYQVTQNEQPLNVLLLTASSQDYGAQNRVTLEASQVSAVRDSRYLMVLMNPAQFHPEELSSSYSLYRLSVSWYFEEGADVEQELQKGQELIARWKPDQSTSYLLETIRASAAQYRSQILWITIVSLGIIGLILLICTIMLFRQKITGLQGQIRCAMKIGLSRSRIRKEIRITQVWQLALALIPSVVIGLIQWLSSGSPLWLITALLTGVLTGIALCCVPIPLPDQMDERRN